MYKKLFAIHSWMGLLSGFVLLVVGFSGSVLLFKDELDGFLRPKLSRAVGEGERLSWDVLLDKVRERDPEARIQVLDLEWAAHPDRSARVQTAGTPSYPNYFNYLYLDPRDGTVLGREKGRFLDWLYYLHFEFLLGWIGRGFLFFFAVAMFLLGASGLYLYRGWFRLLTEPIRKGGSFRTLMADWHKLIGIASHIMLLVLGFTGAWMNYGIFPWFAGDWKRLGMVGLAGDRYNEKPKEEPVVPEYPYLAVEHFLESAVGKYPGLKPFSLEFPKKGGEPAVLYGGSGGWGIFLGNYAYEVKWDPEERKILGAKTPSDLTVLQVFDNICDVVHMGRYGGLPVRLFYALMGLAPGILAVTGFLMFLRRRRP